MSQRAAVRRKQAIFRWVTVSVVLAFFMLPLIGMLDFTTKVRRGGRTMATWKTLMNVSEISTKYPALKEGFIASIGLSVITVVIMLALLVPTMTWVRLRLPGMSRLVEFICLLPLTVPAIVLVVGLAPVYSWVFYLFGESTLWLGLAYVILVLPYAYRALDAGLRAIDVKTLSEAARSLGASWFTVMWRSVLPNLLGEFTIANLFSRRNLQVAMYQLGKSDAKISVAVGLLSLVFAFVVLFAMSFVGAQRSGSRRRRRPLAAAVAPAPAGTASVKEPS